MIPPQPWVGKFWISLVLLNFLSCQFKFHWVLNSESQSFIMFDMHYADFSYYLNQTNWCCRQYRQAMWWQHGQAIERIDFCVCVYSSHLVIFTAHKRSLEQGNIFAPVCHSVHRGGMPQCMLEYHHHHPRIRHTPPDHVPQDHAPRDHTPPGPCIPLVQSMLGDMVNARAVCILLECNLVIKIYSSLWMSLFDFKLWQIRNYVILQHPEIMQFFNAMKCKKILERYHPVKIPSFA